MVKVQNISLLLLSALSASNIVVFGLIPLIDGGKAIPSEYFFIFALANVKKIRRTYECVAQPVITKSTFS